MQMRLSAPQGKNVSHAPTDMSPQYVSLPNRRGCAAMAVQWRTRKKGRRCMGEQLTVLLSRLKDGDRAARDELFAAAYKELRRLAHSRLYGGGRNTVLDTTALVHESYLRLVQAGELNIDDRRAFFAYASQVMRSVIVDTARARLAERRGGDARKITLSTELAQDLGSRRKASSRSTRRCRSWSRPMPGPRRWSRCATSADTATRRSPRPWTSPSARCSATGKRPRCCCG